jgi:ribosomal protein S18 acetylase RimI-like enzyme
MHAQITFRQASAQDFEFCEHLYFEGMRQIIEQLNLDRNRHVTSFQQQWSLPEVSILVVDGADVGWMQSSVQGDELFLKQLFVDGPCQNRGIGTQVLRQLIADAERTRHSVRLDVVKINPALRLYKRLGFRIVGEDERKFFMKYDPAGAAPIAN